MVTASQDGIAVTIEELSDELRAAYSQSGMSRANQQIDMIGSTFGGNALAPFAVGRLDGEVVGVSAYIQDRFVFGDNDGTAVQAVDSFVFPAARGKGLFHRLATSYREYAAANGADLIWGFPNDNARQAWFGKQGWIPFGQVPFMIRLLRSGPLARRLHLPFNVRLTRYRDRGLAALDEIGEWADDLWASQRPTLQCGRVRDRAFLARRLFGIPSRYRVVIENPGSEGALVATSVANKHGMRLGYLMEAIGQAEGLRETLASELGRLADADVEAVLAWSFPWSPNHETLRACGFLPLPQRLRPTNIWFGANPLTKSGSAGDNREAWYLSYLDSDTV